MILKWLLLLFFFFNDFPLLLLHSQYLYIYIHTFYHLLCFSGMDGSSSNGPTPKALPSFFCPITREIYKDPVFTVDGQTYERAAIEKWFKDGNSTSPATNLKLKNTKLTANIVLRKVMVEFTEKKRIERLRLDSSVYDLLSKYTLLKDRDREEYASLFEAQGSYCIKLLLDAEYTKEDLANLGVKRLHISSILEAIQAAGRGFPDERQGGLLRGVGNDEMQQQELEQRPPPRKTEHEKSSQERCREALNILRAKEGRSLEAVDGWMDVKHVLEAMAGGGGRGEDFMTEQDLKVLGGEVADVLVHSILEEEWSGDTNTILMYTLRAMNHLIAKRSGFMKDLVDRGICQKLIKILRSFKEDVVIQTEGWKLVSSLSGTESYLKKLVDAGECKAVIDSLTAMPWDPEIQKCVWYAVVRLLEGSKRNSDKYNVELGNGGACKLVGDTLLHFMPDGISDPSVALQALYAIHALAHSKGNKERFSDIGICTLVVQTLDKFFLETEALKIICYSIGELANGNQDNRRQLSEAEACQGVALVLHRYQSNRVLQLNCLWAIADLCSEDDKENQKRLRVAGVCNNILRALGAFQRLHSDAQAAGCAAIANMTSGGNEANAREFGPDGCGLVVKAVEFHHTNKNVLKPAFKAMWWLAHGQELNVRALVAADAQGEISHALRTFTSSDTSEVKMVGQELLILLGRTGQDEGRTSARRLDSSKRQRTARLQ